MLSRLRKLEEAVIEESKNMPITYDITQDKYYKQGEARGEARGILKTKIDTALTMLKAGKYLVSEIAVITGLSKKKVEELTHLSSYTKE
ncbi:MAG TPA: hypothetical protein ENJ82_06030 [Bacteroidetes bacterium]|nr:hypothetical protein [Bacteroidota bacterium]